MAKKKTPKKMTIKQLAHYRELLIEKLQEITGDVFSMEESVFSGSGELSSMPVHLADIGTDSYEQEFNLGLMAEEKKLLAEILQALQRIVDGTFGFCEGLGIPIETNRLEAIPWTRYSMEYARMLESGNIIKVHNFKRRPIDIIREEDKDEDQEDSDTVGDESDDIMEGQMQSLDDLEEGEEEDDEDDDFRGHRDSA
jgi:RNA polymerase-binding transcription factor DksA